MQHSFQGPYIVIEKISSSADIYVSIFLRCENGQCFGKHERSSRRSDSLVNNVILSRSDILKEALKSGALIKCGMTSIIAPLMAFSMRLFKGSLVDHWCNHSSCSTFVTICIHFYMQTPRISIFVAYIYLV